MSKRRRHRRAARLIKEPIKYDPADLSNVVACLGEIKNIMLMLVAEIERIEYTPPNNTAQQKESGLQEEKPQEEEHIPEDEH